jgi:hypothetical protein
MSHTLFHMNHVRVVAFAQEQRCIQLFFLYISIMIQSSVDFVCILPELTMLILSMCLFYLF